MDIHEFLDKVCQRPLPQNPMARIRTLAKELAEGAVEVIVRNTMSSSPTPTRLGAQVRSSGAGGADCAPRTPGERLPVAS